MTSSRHTPSPAATPARGTIVQTSEESEAFDAHSGSTPPPTHVTGRLLRRAEAARMLGVSKSTLRRMEGTELRPTIGPQNVRMFHEEEIRSVVVTRRGRVDAGSDAGELAAEAFQLFDDGLGAVEAVKRLRAQPEVIESLYSQWARLRGMMLLSAPGRSAVCTALLGWDNGSLKTEEAFVAFIKKWVTEESIRQCVQCKREWGCFCRSCARRWGMEQAMRQLVDDEERKL